MERIKLNGKTIVEKDFKTYFIHCFKTLSKNLVQNDESI